jgi:hypothetical protein
LRCYSYTVFLIKFHFNNITDHCILANLEDFALKLNQPKAEIAEFIRIQINGSLIEL